MNTPQQTRDLLFEYIRDCCYMEQSRNICAWCGARQTNLLEVRSSFLGFRQVHSDCIALWRSAKKEVSR